MKIKGSKWWKFDFHVHTPASVDYGKDEVELKKITHREWLLSVMEKGIDCIAITDHNTGSWIDVLKNELTNMKKEQCEGYRDLYIFPGIEITVNGGIHLLAIFDLDKGSEDIAELIGAIEYSGTKGASDGGTRKSFEHVVQSIINKGGIPIPAHVDIESGIFKEESGTSLRDSIKSDGILALEVHDPEFNKPQVYKELVLNHSEVIGSDSHRPEDIGRFFTWVKMEEPSLDALWLALHDGKDGVLRYDDSSIRYNPNDITSRFFIKKLIIENGAKIGLGPNKFEIEFSPWMSTIIGGRGSGKSSILNYIRLAINGEEELTDSLKREFEEFAKVSEGRNKIGMLRENTRIRVEILKDNREIALIWDKYDIYEEHYDQMNNQWIGKGKAMDINKDSLFVSLIKRSYMR
ncbi:AAA family ATPase [Clostridioides difficile]|uniref:AAA family ATPase n=1 Tax=Clostridioides difficile TaxID=1496 RepID=UPI00355AE255